MRHPVRRRPGAPALLFPHALLPLGPHRTGRHRCEAIAGVEWSVRYAPFKDPANQVAYFHATYRDHPISEAGKDLVLLDTRKTEGGGDWSGQFVGTSFIFSHDADLNTLEGDPRFFFDDSLTPQAQGTGTEEWGGGGDYWGGLQHDAAVRRPPRRREERQGRGCPGGQDRIGLPFSAGRPDALRQERPASIWSTAAPTNPNEHYETVTYWYGLPGALADQDGRTRRSATRPASRRTATLRPKLRRRTRSPRATNGASITLNGKEIYPAHTDRGRTTKTASEFTLKIDPRNLGRDAAPQTRLFVPEPARRSVRR